MPPHPPPRATSWLLCAAALAFVSSTGCTAIQKALGTKQDLKEEKVASLQVRSLPDRVCPGSPAELIVAVTLQNGNTLVSDGAGAGRVTWDSFKLGAEGLRIDEYGRFVVPPDARELWLKPPAIHVRASDHPHASAVFPVPLRFDCAYTADFSGADGAAGSDGVSGSDETETSKASNGSSGSDGDHGGDAASLRVTAALVRNPSGEELLQVRVAKLDGSDARHYLLDPNGTLRVLARGGDGGDGGNGGDGGSPDGLKGEGGRGGDGGRGGNVELVIDEDARAFQDRIRLETRGGRAGRSGSSGEDGPSASRAPLTVLADAFFGAFRSTPTDGESGQVTIRTEPVEPLW